MGRIQAEMMGARNALLWYTHTAVQPAKVTYPIGDANCLKCHSEVTLARDQNNHFHYFLARWQAADGNAGKCISCHGGHSTDGTADSAFLTESQVTPVCQACHQLLQVGG
jgi:predicted CXXCH cytochrome family protein